MSRFLSILAGTVLLASLSPVPQALGQTPYQDPKGRFTVTPAATWTLAPGFGELNGISFVVAGDRRHGRASLRIRTSQTHRPNWARTLATSMGDGAKIKVLSPATVSGVSAEHARVVRRAVDDGRREHYVDVYSFSTAGQSFALIADRRRTDTPFYTEAFAAMLASFRAAAPAVAAPPPPQRTERPVGRWRNGDGLVLLLEDSGRFELADVSGRYRVEGTKLVLELPGQGEEAFSFRMRQGALLLSSPNLPEEVTYRRVEGAATASKDPPSAAPAPLAGKWYGPKGKIVLVLGADGRFELGPYQGAWMVGDGRLRLAKSKTEIVEYSYALVGGTLKLSGGDLDVPVVFRRTAL